MAETKRTLYREPIILPLNADGELYVIQDETGNTIGTGTREICEVLVAIMKSEGLNFSRPDKRSRPLEERKEQPTNAGNDVVLIETNIQLGFVKL